MKFLTDQDVYACTLRFIRDLGHDALAANSLDFKHPTDLELLRAARNQNRIFVTRDRDFGGLVFVENAGTGVIYLRMQPSVCNWVHQELKRVLSLYTEQILLRSFVVVEVGRHRIRMLNDGSSINPL